MKGLNSWATLHGSHKGLCSGSDSIQCPPVVRSIWIGFLRDQQTDRSSSSLVGCHRLATSLCYPALSLVSLSRVRLSQGPRFCCGPLVFCGLGALISIYNNTEIPFLTTKFIKRPFRAPRFCCGPLVFFGLGALISIYNNTEIPLLTTKFIKRPFQTLHWSLEPELISLQV